NLIDSVKLIRNGSEETVLEISGDIDGEPITQRLTMYKDVARVDLEDTVHWTPGRAMEIQQVFPTDMPDAEVRNGVPFGSVSAKEMMPGAGPRSHDEVPKDLWDKWRQIQYWIAASTPDWNLTISADHQLFTVDKDAIRGDLIRGTTFNQLRTYEDGKPVPVKQPTPGNYVFRYSISSGAGDWAHFRSWQKGMAFSNNLIPVVSEDELSEKTLPPEQSFLQVDGDSLVVSALKKADKGNGIVVRLFEEAGQTVDTPIRFLGQNSPFQSINLMESQDGHPSESTLHVDPYKIKTVELQPSAR